MQPLSHLGSLLQFCVCAVPAPGAPAAHPPRADLGTFSGEAESKWLVWLRRIEIIWEQATHPILQVCLYGRVPKNHYFNMMQAYV